MKYFRRKFWIFVRFLFRKKKLKLILVPKLEVGASSKSGTVVKNDKTRQRIFKKCFQIWIGGCDAITFRKKIGQTEVDFLYKKRSKTEFSIFIFPFFLKNQDGFTARCPQWFHSLQFGSFETETEKFENLSGKFGPEPGPRPADPDVVDQRVGGADANQKSKTCGLNQGILKGEEVSLYRWPPVWLVWISLFWK